MNLTDLPTELQITNLNYMDLKTQQFLSLTCQHYNELINNPEHLKNRLLPQDLKMANSNFFKKFFDIFSLDHIIHFNFRLISRNELKQIANQDIKRNKMVHATKLLHSIQHRQLSIKQEYQQHIQDNQRGLRWQELSLQQIDYCCMFLEKCYFDMQPWANGVIAGNTECLKLAEMNLSEETENKKIEEIKNKNPGEDISLIAATGLLTMDHYRLQFLDENFLQQVYTTFWKNYDVKHLDNQREITTHPGEVFTCMLDQMFEGFCNAVQANGKDFGRFNNFYLTENNLKAWNRAFKDKKMELLNVCLMPDVSIDSLNIFANILLSFDPKTSVQVSYKGLGSTPVSDLFSSLKVQILQKNPNWKWAQIP